MCGRFAFTSPLEAVRRLFRFQGSPNLAPRWNVAPTQKIAAIRQGKDGRVIVLLRWGLIPSWTRDVKAGPPLINARAETLASKPSFRNAFRARRCIVPVDAYYEWKPVGGKKQPYAFSRADGDPMALAGIWESWTDPATGEVVESCAVVTTAANELAQNIHDRMPVILDAESVDRWLDPATTEAELNALLAPFPADRMTARPVSPRVNSIRNDDAGCLEPADSGLLI